MNHIIHSIPKEEDQVHKIMDEVWKEISKMYTAYPHVKNNMIIIDHVSNDAVELAIKKALEEKDKEYLQLHKIHQQYDCEFCSIERKETTQKIIEEVEKIMQKKEPDFVGNFIYDKHWEELKSRLGSEKEEHLTSGDSKAKWATEQTRENMLPSSEKQDPQTKQVAKNEIL